MECQRIKPGRELKSFRPFTERKRGQGTPQSHSPVATYPTMQDPTARYPTIQLHSDTVSLKTASDPTG